MTSKTRKLPVEALKGGWKPSFHTTFRNRAENCELGILKQNTRFYKDETDECDTIFDARHVLGQPAGDFGFQQPLDSVVRLFQMP